MFAVGLTGGIGAGKSAAADLLEEKGAVVIDADLIAREVVEPGGPAYQPLVDRFGGGILDSEGRVDRPALAAVVFGDPAALADLNAITHPVIGITMLERRNAFADRDTVVVLAIPLLKPAHRETVGLNAVAVVDCPVDLCVERLVDQRGMDPADATARVAAQINREERCRDADFVLDNSSTREHLSAEVDRLWRWIEEHRTA
jgi:dephospho-CoA kinase